MSYKIEVRPLVMIEMAEGFDWYESQRQGLGYEFPESVDQFIAGLTSNPFTHSFYDEPVRQGAVNRFPYNVVYEIIGTAVVIYSVFMSKQDPKKKRTK